MQQNSFGKLPPVSALTLGAGLRQSFGLPAAHPLRAFYMRPCYGLRHIDLFSAGPN